MSEQVEIQVREGVWRTRDGREIVISLRDFGDAEPTSFVWFSKSTGEYETWRDDGRNTLSKFPQPLDLVEYLRPLPGTEAEPTPEPEPVQVRPGIWKTRDGQLVEVVKSDNTAPARYQWAGLLLGVNESWRDDGRWSVKNEANHRDLVTYVGPLPEHTLSDTLAEIEEQPSEPEPDGETWKALAIRHDAACQMMQTERDNLAQRLEAATAEGCRFSLDLYRMTGERDNLKTQLAAMGSLEQQLADMTEHARELLESAQQAREAQDSLEQQLATMTSDRDTLRRQLAEMTTDRNQLQAQLLRVTADRDNLLQLRDRLQATLQEQRQAIDAARAVQQQLATMTTDRDRVQAELQQTRIDLEAERQVPRSDIAISDAAFAGFNKGKTWAFREVCDWLRPFVGANPEDAAALLDAVPGLVKRLAQCEGVEI